MDRDKAEVLVGGAVLMVIGAALLLDRTGIFVWTGRWSVWALLIIGYGLVTVWWSRATGVFLIGFGAWLAAADAGWVPLRQSWPLLIVALGLGVMWQAWAEPEQAGLTRADRRSGRARRAALVILAVNLAVFSGTRTDAWRMVTERTSGSDFQVISILGGARRSIVGPAFTSGDVVTVMGGNEIDLRDATLAPGAEAKIDLLVVMGGSVIRVPDGWAVELRAVPVLGGVADKRWSDASSAAPRADAPKLVIEGTVLMGGVTIKS